MSSTSTSAPTSRRKARLSAKQKRDMKKREKNPRSKSKSKSISQASQTKPKPERRQPQTKPEAKPARPQPTPTPTPKLSKREREAIIARKEEQLDYARLMLSRLDFEPFKSEQNRVFVVFGEWKRLHKLFGKHQASITKKTTKVEKARARNDFPAMDRIYKELKSLRFHLGETRAKMNQKFNERDMSIIQEGRRGNEIDRWLSSEYRLERQLEELDGQSREFQQDRYRYPYLSTQESDHDFDHDDFDRLSISSEATEESQATVATLATVSSVSTLASTLPAEAWPALPSLDFWQGHYQS